MSVAQDRNATGGGFRRDKRVEVIAFTERGCRLALRIAEGLAGDVRVAGPERFADGLGVGAYESLEAWTAAAFRDAAALVFVGASGIAVRAVAPHVRDKFCDPAVVSVDEHGHVAVPLLSGHVGGANDLARDIAHVAGGIAAVSTATDLNGQFAIDEFARDNGLAIAERSLAKEVSAALLEGRAVSFGDDLGAIVGDDLALSPFERTLHLVPRAVVGVGCRRGAEPAALEGAVDRALEQAGFGRASVRAVATIGLKADEPAILALAARNGWRLRTFSAEELARVEGDFSSSEFVQRAVGVDNVCERAACAHGGTLVVKKQSGDGVTVAIAVEDAGMPGGGAARRLEPKAEDCHGTAPVGSGELFVVGIGPGGAGDMTGRAREALAACDVIAGYSVYVDLVRDEFPDKELITTPMRGEVERCRMALEAAAGGRTVSMVCSGDPGVYGMAGLVFELAGGFPGVSVQVIPGVTAATGGAAVLGAPLMHDWCAISLSDLLTPWETIERRLVAAAEGDFAISLYNPSSHKRPDHLKRACDILLRYKDPATVCGMVSNVGREGEEARVMTLADLRDASVDMFTTVFVGNSQTVEIDGRMVTPRGYLQRKG